MKPINGHYMHLINTYIFLQSNIFSYINLSRPTLKQTHDGVDILGL